MLKRAFFFLVLALQSSLLQAQYNTMPFGTGFMSGGTSCPYGNMGQQGNRVGGMQPNSGGSSRERSLQARITKIDRDLEKNEKEIDYADRDITDGKEDIKREFKPEVSAFVIRHISSNVDCESYRAACTTAATGSTCAVPAEMRIPFLQTWCAKGSVNSGICSAQNLKKESSGDCATVLSRFAEAVEKKREYQSKVRQAERDRNEAERNLERARDNVSSGRSFTGNRSNTEAGVCLTCNISSGLNIAAGIGTILLGQRLEKQATTANAMAGLPSTQSYGYPYMMAGMNGIINGLSGPGAYGCSSSNGMSMTGGAFGYPQSMYAMPQTGSMYLPQYAGTYPYAGNYGYPYAQNYPYTYSTTPGTVLTGGR